MHYHPALGELKLARNRVLRSDGLKKCSRALSHPPYATLFLDSQLDAVVHWQGHTPLLGSFSLYPRCTIHPIGKAEQNSRLLTTTLSAPLASICGPLQRASCLMAVCCSKLYYEPAEPPEQESGRLAAKRRLLDRLPRSILKRKMRDCASVGPENRRSVELGQRGASPDACCSPPTL